MLEGWELGGFEGDACTCVMRRDTILELEMAYKV